MLWKKKKIRQAFSSAVLNGSRSGSGKLVVEYYDQLVEIYGGTASTQPLRFGCESSQQSSSTDDTGTGSLSLSAGQEQSSCSFINLSCTPATTDEPSAEDFEGQEGNLFQTPVSKDKKRNCPKDPVQLIDDKRQHLEKSLSA